MSMTKGVGLLNRSVQPPDSALHVAAVGGACAAELREVVRDQFTMIAGVSITSDDEHTDVFRSQALQDCWVESYTDANANFFGLSLEPLDLGSARWNNSESLDLAFWVCIGALSDGVKLLGRGRVRVEVRAIDAVFLYSFFDRLLNPLDAQGRFFRGG